MTIITKLTEKKVEAGAVDPDVTLNIDPSAPINDDSDELILRTQLRRVNHSFAFSFCMLLSLLMFLVCSILTTAYLYEQYNRQQVQKLWCKVPYDRQISDEQMLNDGNVFEAINRDMQMMNSMIEKELSDDNRFFKERFEIDVDNESYEKIDVPDFQGGRRGRFVHDFNTNKTGIVDLSHKRCFVMPLDRETVLPPKSLFDLVMKMWQGYYDVDTHVVRRTMRVKVPPVTDLELVGSYISQECANMPVYMLEAVNATRVAKRSISDAGKYDFIEFSGQMAKYNIMGLDSI